MICFANTISMLELAMCAYDILGTFIKMLSWRCEALRDWNRWGPLLLCELQTSEAPARPLGLIRHWCEYSTKGPNSDQQQRFSLEISRQVCSWHFANRTTEFRCGESIVLPNFNWYFAMQRWHISIADNDYFPISLCFRFGKLCSHGHTSGTTKARAPSNAWN